MICQMKKQMMLNGKFSFLLLALLCISASRLFGQSPPQIIWEQPAHSSGTASVEFSPDGTRLASGGWREVLTGSGIVSYAQVNLWNAADGALLSATPDTNFGATNEISFAPDGQRLVTANGAVGCAANGGCYEIQPGIAAYSVAGLAQTNRLLTDSRINATVDHSPDGQLIAAGEFYGDFKTRIYRASDFSLVRTLPGHFIGANNGATWSVRFSPDGQLLASSGKDSTVKLWRVSDGALVRTLQIEDPLDPNVVTVAFSPNNEFIAASTTAFKLIKIWRVSDGQVIRNFNFNESGSSAIPTSNLIFTPDSRYLVAGRAAYNEPIKIRFFDVSSGQVASDLVDSRPNRNISSLSFSPNGRLLAYGSGRFVIVARNPLAQSGSISDFDGDGRADVAVYRGGVWYLQQSARGFATAEFGLPTDRIMPQDYDGDGKSDFAIYRDGTWWTMNSSDSRVQAVQWGLSGDVAQPGDYDGDGLADFAVFREGIWYVRHSTGSYRYENFGLAADKPVAADYDGDRKIDLAVFRSGVWYFQLSRDGFRAVQFGLDGDLPVPADYDGDGKTDVAVYRAGVWHVLQSSNNQYRAQQFGFQSDKPVPADYDGDGRADIAVYRDGDWYLFCTTQGLTVTQFGLASDSPIPAAYIQ